MFVVVYGLEISSNKDDLPHQARETIEQNDALLIPGWDAFKTIPFIHKLPSWCPGGQIRVSHEAFAVVVDQLAEGSFQLTMNAIMKDDNHSSLISELISQLDVLDEAQRDKEIERIKWMGFQSLTAAADTTMSAISTFFLVMSLYPDVQLKAQKELDDILGPGRLPTFDDRLSLPYVEAVYREVMRWHPAIPMGK
ncbi:hypothetical protein VKT23_018148 [Stygiomarasmius scandens]|uniref:Cytochrome P450 n=1 Tax=Marasmiellus scandens TaxID=2682957 RepID=A0ABR1IQ11_9AGAR